MYTWIQSRTSSPTTFAQNRTREWIHMRDVMLLVIISLTHC